MPSRPDEWVFKVHQRNDVCEGKLCPRCLSTDIKLMGMAPDGERTNQTFLCKTCDEQWERY